ncbi:MAG: hypothetical protein H7061_04240 [Bdellovibrionaceae bacterium]|nr:hypothetical protein [Bdellovibrio sp.]
MKKLLIASLFLISSVGAWAADGAGMAKTTDMFSPKGGQSEIVPRLRIYTGTSTSGNTTSTYSGQELNFEFGHAITDSFGFYIWQDYANYQTDTTPGSTVRKTNGLGDTKIGIKSVVDMGQVFLYYDVGYEMGLLAKSTANQTSNEYSPVTSRPFVEVQGGLGVHLGMVGLGGLVKYDLYQAGETENQFVGNKSTQKNKAGTGLQWKAYFQLEPSFKLGLSYGEQAIEAYDTESGVLTTVNAKSENKTVSIYAIFPFASSSEIMVEVAKPEPKTTTATYSYYIATLSYRLRF